MKCFLCVIFENMDTSCLNLTASNMRLYVNMSYSDLPTDCQDQNKVSDCYLCIEDCLEYFPCLESFQNQKNIIVVKFSLLVPLNNSLPWTISWSKVILKLIIPLAIMHENNMCIKQTNQMSYIHFVLPSCFHIGSQMKTSANNKSGNKTMVHLKLRHNLQKVSSNNSSLAGILFPLKNLTGRSSH